MTKTTRLLKPDTATLEDLSWMCGPWQGELGPQRVREDWSPAESGTMSTMVRLLEGDTTVMIELIVISERNTQEGHPLTLHLRQFSAELELQTSQTMPLAEISEHSVTFVCADGASISKLTYKAANPVGKSQEQMDVHVTLVAQAPNPELTVVAHLVRPT